MGSLGLGIGWRPELAETIAHREDLGFVELRASDLDLKRGLPRAVRELKGRGVKIVLHGTRLSLGSEPLDMARVEHLARLADVSGACVVSDHVCFVRAGDRAAGHLLPVPFNDTALDVLSENITRVKRVMPAPFAVENIASFIRFPGGTMEEARFLARLIAFSGALLLLDLSNLHWNGLNHGFDSRDFLAELPLDRVAYMHLGGGIHRDGVWQDTHAHPLPVEPLALLAGLRRAGLRAAGAMLERDFDFPTADELHRELDNIAAAR